MLPGIRIQQLEAAAGAVEFHPHQAPLAALLEPHFGDSDERLVVAWAVDDDAVVAFVRPMGAALDVVERRRTRLVRRPPGRCV